MKRDKNDILASADTEALKNIVSDTLAMAKAAGASPNVDVPPPE